jgi:pimeloyl-ACP methyl ester carboxylesterase
MVDGDDLYGDGVNVAARLEAIAEVGGICISGASHDEVEHKLELNFRALGLQTLKNIPRPVMAYAIEVVGATPAKQPLTRYCRTPDGVRLAYAVAGTGPNLVMAGRWFTHLEYNWANPNTKGEAFIDLARDFRFLRYDTRGNGLSDWEVSEISLDAWVQDLEVVVDAAGYDQFALLGGSQGAPTAISYAASHPERVSHLILNGGYALGWRKRPGSNIEQHEAMVNLMRQGWDSPDPSYRQLFASQFMPNATKEEWEAANESMRVATSPETAARYYQAFGEVDVTALLPRVQARTLVMHVRGDRRVPFESGRQIAAAIPNARFVALPGDDHAFSLGSPAADRYLEEIRLFLRG